MNCQLRSIRSPGRTPTRQQPRRRWLVGVELELKLHQRWGASSVFLLGGAFVTSTSLLRFHSSCRDECTGNGGPARMSTARQRADSVLVLLALRVTPWARVLSLGTQLRQSTLPWPWVTTGLGQNGLPNVQSPRFRGQSCDSLVDDSCLRRRRE